MVKVNFIFVPPGGGEADYQLLFELPSIPQPGDYISIRRKDADSPHTEDFIVRRSWWWLEYPDSDLYKSSDKPETVGHMDSITVECEFARGPHLSQEHKKSCDRYDHKHKEYSKNDSVRTFDITCY